MPIPFVVLSLGRTSRYVFSAHARGVASCCSATFRLTHPRRRRPRWSRSPSFSLVLERFLKNRNCEPQLLQRNQFIYCIETLNEPESELERNRNHLSTIFHAGKQGTVARRAAAANSSDDLRCHKGQRKLLITIMKGILTNLQSASGSLSHIFSLLVPNR